MIKHTTPTEKFAEYTITQEQRSEIERLALKINSKSLDGTYWLHECFTNTIGLTPRHVSENFGNIRIELGNYRNTIQQTEWEKYVEVLEKGGEVK